MRITVLTSLVLAIAVPGSGGGSGADGSGNALTIFGSVGRAVTVNGSLRIDHRAVGFRWSRRWRPTGTGPLRGNPTLSVELIPYVEFDQEPDAWAPALNLIYEHRFTTSAGVHPALKAGAGILYSNTEVPPGETRLNFSLLVGFALDIDLSRRWQLAPEYRFHHVSNANTGPVNPGINAHTYVIGVSIKLGVRER